ncbi:MAG: glycosyltransferase [Rhodospirillales bacterium]|nr:glycosyltransferase [Rhodospirillales bacterium]
MHFVVLGSMSPEDEAFFSGTSRHFVENLRRLGHQVTALGPLEPQTTLRDRVKAGVYRRFFGQTYEIDRNPAVMQARATQANALLRRIGRVDAVVTIYPPDAAYVETPAPLLVMHDATWHQLLDFYPGMERHRVPRETIAGGYELDRLGFINCDHVIMSSRWAAESVVRDYGIASAKVTACSFGANLSAVPSPAEFEGLIARRGRGPCRLLFIGFDWRRKGGDGAVAIAREVAARGLPVELNVVGCRPPDGSADFVRPHGVLSKKIAGEAARLEQLLREADFFVLPTRADCTPMAISEAAAHWLPVVTTTVGGVADMIGGEPWGLALAPDAPPGLSADWIVDSYRDRGRYLAMAIAARRAADERLNWAAFIAKLCDIASELQHGGPRHGTDASLSAARA